MDSINWHHSFIHWECNEPEGIFGSWQYAENGTVPSDFVRIPYVGEFRWRRIFSSNEVEMGRPSSHSLLYRTRNVEVIELNVNNLRGDAPDLCDAFNGTASFSLDHRKGVLEVVCGAPIVPGYGTTNSNEHSFLPPIPRLRSYCNTCEEHVQYGVWPHLQETKAWPLHQVSLLPVQKDRSFLGDNNL
jgi:hypothetical protein